MNAGTNRFLAVTLDVRVSTYDIDYAGHVSNISYFRWLEYMRLKILEEYFPLNELMEEGYMPILAGSQIKYKRAIRLFDKPKGEMWISDITAATMTFSGTFFGELVKSVLKPVIKDFSSVVQPLSLVGFHSHCGSLQGLAREKIRKLR